MASVRSLSFWPEPSVKPGQLPSATRISPQASCAHISSWHFNKVSMCLAVPPAHSLPTRPARSCTALSCTSRFPHRLQAARTLQFPSSFLGQELHSSTGPAMSALETDSLDPLIHGSRSPGCHTRASHSCLLLRLSSLRSPRRRQPELQKCFATNQDANQVADRIGSDSREGRVESVHFVGIGGAGLSALASLALQQGYRVSGSDIEDSEQLARLRAQGATVIVGHSSDNISPEDLPGAVVVSSAVPEGNPEVEAARTRGVPIYKRGEWLAQVTKDFDLIAVSGTHGKTSTTSMLSLALNSCGMDVTALVGAHVAQFPERGSVLVGSSPNFVLEADEYDGCFLHLTPRLAVITNVEWEHVDKFADEEAVRKTFSAFASKLEPGGVLVACGDKGGAPSTDQVVTRSILDSWEVVTYGLEEGNDWRAIMLAPNPQGGTDFVAVHDGAPVARVELPLPGTHNVLNALAVLAVAHNVASWADPSSTPEAPAGVPVADQGPGKASPRPSVRDLLDRHRGVPRGAPGAYQAGLALGAGKSTAALSLQASSQGDTRQRQQQAVQAAAASLATFQGACRRFEVVGRAMGGVVLIDDYAHHPTEIRATLQAARQRFDSVPVWVVFQPHTYSRTARLMDDLAEAFSAANRVIVTEIYAAREQNPWNVSGKQLADVITGPVTTYVPKLDDVVERLAWEARAFINDQTEKAQAAPAIRWPPPPGDLVIISMGAGTVTRVCRELYEQLPKP